jgi:hypothetical protein
MGSQTVTARHITMADTEHLSECFGPSSTYFNVGAKKNNTNTLGSWL